MKAKVNRDNFKETYYDIGIYIIINIIEILKNKYHDKKIPSSAIAPIRHLMNEYMKNNGRKTNYISIQAKDTNDKITDDHAFGTTRVFKKLYCNYIEQIFKDENQKIEYITEFLYRHVFTIRITKKENDSVKTKSGSWVNKYKEKSIKLWDIEKKQEIDLTNIKNDTSIDCEYSEEHINNHFS